MHMKLYRMEIPSANQLKQEPGNALPFVSAMIVGATSEKHAREIAEKNCGAEGRRAWAKVMPMQIGETLYGMASGVYMKSCAPVEVEA